MINKPVWFQLPREGLGRKVLLFINLVQLDVF